MKVLITGGSGDLGSALVRRFERDNEVYAPTHSEMDVTNVEEVEYVIRGYDPEIVIHTAAMIDARKCEENWQQAQLVNVKGTLNVAMAARKQYAKIIHISSTCVFDGENAPFDESCRPSPKNWYALTKFAAEQLLPFVPTRQLIVRTNFVARKPWKYPKAFTDRFGTYLFADDVAFAVHKISGMEDIVHVCGSKRMSMFELAKMVSPDVQPMTLDEYQGPPVSRDMSLVSNRIAPFDIGCGSVDLS
jgi:dTDP-4-dehydrorhamnose reductase